MIRKGEHRYSEIKCGYNKALKMFLKVLALSNFKHLKIVIKFFHSSQGKIPLQNNKRLKTGNSYDPWPFSDYF